MQIRRAIACLAAFAAVAIAVFVWRAGWHAPARNTGAGTAPWTAVPEQTLSHGRFENLTVYAPDTPPRGFVLLLSGADGWTPGMTDTARQFVRQGALVAGIDTRQLAANLEADGSDCVFPDGDLENLSHFVQAYYRLPAYLPPILAGKASGAALAYATLAQAPAKTFGGALSIGFCPAMTLRKPLCKSGGLDFDPDAHGGVDLLPAKQLVESWVVVDEPGASSPGPPAIAPAACDAAAIRRFVAQVPGAQFIQPGGQGESGAAQRPAPYAEGLESLLRKNEPLATTVPPALGDLPLVAVPAQPGTAPSDLIAIMLSGDGGWAGLDKDVAAALAAQGITVVGLDSLRYFWSPRTPEGLAADLDRMVEVLSGGTRATERPADRLLAGRRRAAVRVEPPFGRHSLARRSWPPSWDCRSMRCSSFISPAGFRTATRVRRRCRRCIASAASPCSASTEAARTTRCALGWTRTR